MTAVPVTFPITGAIATSTSIVPSTTDLFPTTTTADYYYGGPLFPLVTQFTEPASCNDNWAATVLSRIVTTTIEVDDFFKSNTSIQYKTLITSDSFANSASCQPTDGYARGTDGGIAFSPALCPSAWTYYSITRDQYAGSPTQAACCKKGFEPAHERDAIGLFFPYYLVVCTQNVTLDRDSPYTIGAANATATPTPLVGDYVKLHTAWHVEWQETDMEQLGTSLPVLRQGWTVSTWVPGTEPIYDRGYYTEYDSRALRLGILIPFILIGALVTICCVGSCVSTRYKKRKARRFGARRGSIDEAEAYPLDSRSDIAGKSVARNPVAVDHGVVAERDEEHVDRESQPPRLETGPTLLDIEEPFGERPATAAMGKPSRKPSYDHGGDAADVERSGEGSAGSSHRGRASDSRDNGGGNATGSGGNGGD